MKIAVLDMDAGRQQRRLAERAQRREKVGVVVDLRGAGNAQRLAGRRHQRDDADLAGRDDVVQAEGQVVADPLGDHQRLRILHPDEARFVALGRHFDCPVRRRRADQGKGAALQELDRLIVQRVEDLDARGRPRLGNDAPQLFRRADASHETTPSKRVSRQHPLLANDLQPRRHWGLSGYLKRSAAPPRA